MNSDSPSLFPFASADRNRTSFITELDLIKLYLNRLLSDRDVLIPITSDDYDDIAARRPNVGLFMADDIQGISELAELIKTGTLRISGGKPCSVMMRLIANPSFIHLEDFPFIVEAIETAAEDFKNSIGFSGRENTASIIVFVFYDD